MKSIMKKRKKKFEPQGFYLCYHDDGYLDPVNPFGLKDLRHYVNRLIVRMTIKNLTKIINLFHSKAIFGAFSSVDFWGTEWTLVAAGNGRLFLRPAEFTHSEGVKSFLSKALKKDILYAKPVYLEYYYNKLAPGLDRSNVGIDKSQKRIGWEFQFSKKNKQGQEVSGETERMFFNPVKVKVTPLSNMPNLRIVPVSDVTIFAILNSKLEICMAPDSIKYMHI